jgi:hypothetical protein
MFKEDMPQGWCPGPGIKRSRTKLGTSDPLVILATQEQMSEGLRFKASPRANSSQDPISKKPITNKGLEEWLKR